MVTDEENDAALDLEPTPTKRLRWATQHKKGTSANRTRMSIVNRLHHRGSRGSKKKRDSNGTNSAAADLSNIQDDPNEGSQPPVDSESEGPRQVHFNIPLNQDALDEDGYPKKSYRRNKIRTAKYTPLSFIPKNLWYQFHTIANIYFFILIILTVRLEDESFVLS